MNTTKKEEIIPRQNKNLITHADALRNNQVETAAQTNTSKQCKQ